MSSPGIAWHDGLLESDDALRSHVAGTLGLAPGDLEVGRHCKRCGSAQHGRPWVRALDGRAPHVSVSRASGRLVTAVSLERPVGIDVESVQRINDHWDPHLVLHAAETAYSRDERAAMWCRKEAILKASGDGLEVPMTSVRCADWQVYDVPAPAGLWASVALLDPVSSVAALATPPRRATPRRTRRGSHR